MNTGLQNKAWSLLPKEFKEEVKYYYQHTDSGSYAEDMLESIFGEHNLISDAEGEEMLTVKAKTVREMYAANERLKADFFGSVTASTSDHINHVLATLFGSKCLPVETQSQNPHENCDTEKHISTDCDKPAEPKFKMGDVVRIKPNAADYHQGYQNGYAWLPERNKYVGKVFSIINVWPSGTIVLNIPDNVYWEAIDLEPYTEPTEKNPKESEETFASDSERRLTIAATILAGIVAREAPARHPVKRALELTDALIAESTKKGGEK